MMIARKLQSRLIERLPAVRGRYTENVALAPITWFRVGGPAEVMFRPADQADLSTFLAEKPVDVPVTVLGVGSNLLVRDGGIPGVVIRLGRAFACVDPVDATIKVGAAALDLTVASVARDAGIGGLEFLSGIPGTVGGALRMNAGAYGAEMRDVVTSAQAIDATGRIQNLARSDFGFGYRRCAVPSDWIFLAATLQGRRGHSPSIASRMDEIRTARESTQPIRARTGGSTFANPPGCKAWELIERAGCRGLVRGGAMVSEQHCNFFINTGTALAADLEELGEDVRKRVFAATGVTLEWEIRRVGVSAADCRMEPAR
jgi:UDP-N-acetylmuramate dehydrogenase